MKRTLAIVFVLATSFAHAQTFFDGFENYAADSGEYVSKGGWGLYSFNDPELYSPVVRTARDGITPYEGTKMLELRCPSIGGFTECYSPALVDGPHEPSVLASVRFSLASANFAGQRAVIGFRTSNGLANYLALDAKTSSYTISGSPVKGNISISLDSWHEVGLRIDYLAKTFRTYFDGTLLQEVPFYTSGNYFPGLALATQNSKVDGYTRSQGGPGVFFDSARASVVPEPPSLLMVVASLLALRGKRGTRS